MIEQPDVLAERFGALSNSLDDSDWLDVERRAGTEQRLGLVRRRTLAAVAVALAALALSPIGGAVAGLGRDAFDGFSSWLQGEPGSPAPTSEQAGFEARNASSYVSFPTDTKVRLLLRERAGGRAFSLLGFRSGSSLCLRLIRSERPEARGTNQCVTLRELRSSPAPALVASEAHVLVGDPALAVDGVFGFSDDTVETIALRRLRGGERTVRVANNVFLALRARPAGTVAIHPPFDPIVQVHAVTTSGRRVNVPFIASDLGDYGSGVPNRPSYMARGGVPASELPGPKRVQRPFTGGTIGWVDRREPRGEPWSPDRLGTGLGGTVLFARAVQPDPESPLRIGVSLIRSDGQARRGPRFEGVMLCSSELRPLTPNETGASCLRQQDSMFFPAGQPLTMSYMVPTQITQVSGFRSRRHRETRALHFERPNRSRGAGGQRLRILGTVRTAAGEDRRL